MRDELSRSARLRASARFRTGLRQFRKWSEAQAATAELTPARHQPLLAIRGHPDPTRPTVGDVASYLLIRSHSAVELIDRAVVAGLVERRQDNHDSRAVRLQLTAESGDRLARLAQLHLEELRRVAPQLEALWKGSIPTVTPRRSPRPPRTSGIGRPEESRFSNGIVHQFAVSGPNTGVTGGARRLRRGSPEPVVTTRDLEPMWRSAAKAALVLAGVAVASFLGGRR